MIKEIKQDIRKQLRRFMNGVVSDSMRRNGIIYKLNFGVSLPKLKEIAANYTPDKELAEDLWKEDVRELKILACILYPKNEFTIETAQQWISEIKYLETVEQFVFHLLQYVPYAEEMACKWVNSSDEYTAVGGFLLFSRLCAKDRELSPISVNILMESADKAFSTDIPRIQRVALNALKRYGRSHKKQAEEVLYFFRNYPLSDIKQKEEIYNDLKFEFDYYL